MSGRPPYVTPRMAECHPERVHEAKGLCVYCYGKKWAEEAKKTLAWKREDPRLKERSRNSMLKTTYGITTRQYDRMMVNQNGVCAICQQTCRRHGRILSVDHNHRTKTVRGLLCQNCNAGLGMFMDSPYYLQRAIEYLDDR